MSALTNNPWLLDTICYVVGGTAISLGLIYLLRAVFADRAKGRRRCPTCWYDMAGVPGLQCPECGRVAKGEARLSRTRRRWGAACVWGLVIVLGIGGALTPRMSKRGLVGMVPTTALVWWAPLKAGPVTSWQFRVPIAMGGRGAQAPLSWERRLEEEMWRRVLEGESWTWQSRALIQRWMRSQGGSIDGLLEVCPRWRMGERVPVRLKSFGGSWSVDFVKLGDQTGRVQLEPRATTTRHGQGVTPGRMRIRETLGVGVGGVCVPVGSFDATIEGVEPGSPLLDALIDEAMTARIKSGTDPHIVVDDHGEDLVVWTRSLTPAWKGLDFPVCLSFRVMLDGRLAGSGFVKVNWDTLMWTEKDSVKATMSWEPGGLQELLAAPEKGTILVTGNMELAERQYRDWPFDCRPMVWMGSFEVPVRVDANRRRGQ